MARSASRLHSCSPRQLCQIPFTLFWITRELGGVRNYQDGDGWEPPKILAAAPSGGGQTDDLSYLNCELKDNNQDELSNESLLILRSKHGATRGINNVKI